MVNGHHPFLLGYGGATAAANYANMQSPTTYKTPPPGKRERTKFSPQQLCYLENQFEKCQYPQGAQREQIARQLSLTDTKVQIWFKNRRAKVRQKKKFEDELQKAHQSQHLKRESTDEELRMPSMENGGTDQEEDNKCRMQPTTTSHHSMITNSSQPHSANHTPTLLQPIQPTAQANEIMPQLSSAMPFMFAQQNIADLGIKLEPLTNDASSLLTAADTTGMSNTLGATPFAPTNPSTGWVNWYGNYSNANFGFPAYSPYSSGSAAVSTPYEPFVAPNYYMNPMNQMPRADLSKFQ